MLDNVVLVGVLTTIARVAAGLKIAVSARYFGAGDAYDVFQTAFLLPALLGEAVTVAFTSGIVPVLTQVRTAQGTLASARLVRSAITIALLLMSLLAAILWLGAPGVIRVLGSSFAESKQRRAQELFLALLLWLPLGAWIATWRGVLHSHGKFAVAAGAQAISPVLTINWLWLGGAQQGTWALVTAILLGALFEGAVLATAARNMGYGCWPGSIRAQAWTPELSSFSLQVRSLMLTALLASVSLLIDQSFAGGLGTGSVSALAYGTKVSGVLALICGTALGSVILPDFSLHAARREWDALGRKFERYAAFIATILIPCAALLMWKSELLVRVIFERGAFDSTHTQMVAAVQRFALAELPFAVLLIVASRLTTALNASRLLVYAGGATVVINAALSWQFSRWWGVPGLTAAGSVTRAIALGIVLILLFRSRVTLWSKEDNV